MSLRCFVVVLVALLFAFDARADIVPANRKRLVYTLELQGLEAFPEYAFLCTSSTHTMATKVDSAKDIDVRDLDGDGVYLYAVKKAALEAHEKATDAGARGRIAWPVPGAVKSNVPIGVVRMVPRTQPQSGLHRILKVSKITDAGLELTVIKNEVAYHDGNAAREVPLGRELLEPPPPAAPRVDPPAPPSKSCGCHAGPRDLGAWLVVLALLRRRRIS